MKNSSFQINAAPTAHSFWETRRVWFADVNLSKNAEAGNDEDGEEKSRLEEEKKQKDEIREKIHAAMTLSNDHEKQKALQRIEQDYGLRLTEFLQKDVENTLTGDEKTHQQVLTLLEGGEISKKHSLIGLLKDRITGQKNKKGKLTKDELQVFLSLSPTEVKKALQDQSKEYWKTYLFLFYRLDSQNEAVQKYTKSYVEKHGESAIAELPKEIREQFATLHYQILFERNEISLQDLRNRAKTLSLKELLSFNKEDISLSGEKKEQKLLESITKNFGENHPDLIQKLESIKTRNEEDSEVSRMKDILETIVAHLKRKMEETHNISLATVREYSKECKFLEGLILSATDEFLSAEKKLTLQDRIAGTNQIIEAVSEALQNNDRVALADSEASKRQVKAVESRLNNFFNNKTFGETMLLLSAERTRILGILYQLKRQKKSLAEVQNELSAQNISIDQFALSQFIKDAKDDIPTSAIGNLEYFLPNDFRGNDASKKALSSYIENPLAHTEGISSEMVNALLQNETAFPKVETIFAKPIAVVGAELMSSILSHHTEMMIEETSAELRGKTQTEALKERYQDFMNLENTQKAANIIHSSAKKILKQLDAIYPKTEIREKQKVKASLQEVLQSVPQNIDRTTESEKNNAFAEILSTLRNQAIAEEKLPSEVDRDLENMLSGFWKRLTVQIEHWAQLAENHHEQFKQEVQKGILVKSALDVENSTLPIGKRLQINTPAAWETMHSNEKLWESQFASQVTMFKLLDAQKGWNEQAIYAVQHIIKNCTDKKGGQLIIPTENVLQIPHFDPQQRRIILPAELYKKLENFPNATPPLREAEFTMLWHEMLHLKVHLVDQMLKDPNGGSVKRFDTHIFQNLSHEQQERYKNLKLEFQKSGIDGNASVEEEIMVMIGAELQKSKGVRQKYLSPDKRTKGHIVNDIINLVGEEKLMQFSSAETSALIKELNKKLPTYFSNINAANDDQYTIAANQNTGNQTEEEIARAQALANNQPLQESIEEESGFSEDDRKKKMKQYESEAKKLRGKMDIIRRQIKESGESVPESLQKTLIQCENILNAGKNLLQNAKTKEEADHIITSLENRGVKENDEEKAKKLGTDKTSVKGVLDSIIQQLNDFPKDDRGYFVKMWGNTDFLALKDFGILKNTLFEYIKRRWKDQQNLRVNKVGKTITPKWWIFSGLENEFSNAEEGAHAKVVKTYADAIANETNSYISQVFLKNVTNKEALKAGIQHLVKGGNMDWQSDTGKTVADKLKLFGSGINFDKKEDFKIDAHSEMIMRLKFKKAINRVYGDETLFDKWYNDNKAANDGSVKKGMEQVADINYQEDQVQEWLRHVSIYHDKENDPSGELKKEFYVKKQILEGFIYGTLGDGNFGNAQRAMYYLIMGVAQGALQPKAVDRAWAKLVSIYPAFQFTSGASKAQCVQWQKEILWDAENKTFRQPWSAPPEWFDAWVDSKMMTNSGVIYNRMQNIKDWKMDHDNSYFVMSTGTSNLALNMLYAGDGGKEGGNRFKQMPSGSLRYFSNLALSADQIKTEDDSGEKFLRKNILRHAGFYSVLQGVSTQEITPEGNYQKPYQFTRDILEDEPRGSGKGYNENMKIKDYFSAQNEFFLALQNVPNQDPAFASFLQLVYGNGRNLSSENFATQWNTLLSESPVLQKALQGKDFHLKGRNETFFSQAVPYILEYFIGEKSDKHPMKNLADTNYQTLLESIKNLSAGQGINNVEGSSGWGNKNYNAIVQNNKKFISQTSGERIGDPQLKKYLEGGELKWNTDGSFKKVA